MEEIYLSPGDIETNAALTQGKARKAPVPFKNADTRRPWAGHSHADDPRPERKRPVSVKNFL
jgi:hypothetical protein